MLHPLRRRFSPSSDFSRKNNLKFRFDACIPPAPCFFHATHNLIVQFFAFSVQDFPQPHCGFSAQTDLPPSAVQKRISILLFRICRLGQRRREKYQE
jgi:hypothetical protein